MPVHRVSRGRDETATASRTTNRRRQRGQTLVEFALVVPLFMGILIAIVEFAFTFNAVLAAQYSSRDAALVAAEAGNADGADCAILRDGRGRHGGAGRPERPRLGRGLPGDARRATRSAPRRSTRGAARSTAPCPTAARSRCRYTRTQDGYPEAGRCNVLAGCAGRELDHVGVKVTYRYQWKTPIGHGFSPYLDVTRSNSMRMEPVL